MTPEKVEAFFNSLIMRDNVLPRYKQTWKNFLRSFPSGYSTDFKNFANDVFCSMYNYLICYDRDDKQKAWCTHCGKKIVLAKDGKHNGMSACPKCGYTAVIIHNWRKSKPIQNWGHLLHYDKADYNKSSIVARGIYVVRTIHIDTLKIEWQFRTRCYYLFQPGKCEFREHIDHNWYAVDVLQTHKSIYPIFNQYSVDAVTAENVDSLYKAAKQTKWQYVLPQNLTDIGIHTGTTLKLLAEYDKHPQIEYLMKAGFNIIITRKIAGDATSEIINWRARTLQRAVKMPLSKTDFKYIKSNSKNLTYEALRLFKLLKADNPNKALSDFNAPHWVINSEYETNQVVNLYKTIGNVEKIFEYIRRQHDLLDPINRDPLRTPSYILSDWRDYLNECQKLGLNLKDTAVIMPHNLQQAHTNTAIQIKAKENAEMDALIAKNKKKRQIFNYKYGNLFCRPAEGTKELVAEGKMLVHCVGTYAERYAEGTTNIVFIRRADEPAKPFYTMEISSRNEIVQVRGFRNCGMTEDVQDFVEHFKKEILSKLKRKGRNVA